MNKLRTVLSIFLSAYLLLGCIKDDMPVSISFNSTSYSLKVGDTLDLGKEVKTENTEETPVFSSSDESLATITGSGLMTALAAGEVTVKAVVEGKEATAAVQISPITIESISLDGPQTIIAGEDWINVVATVKPAEYSAENLEWTITASDEEIGLKSEKVSSKEYKIKVASYKEGGKVVVNVKDKNSDTASALTIEVKAAPVEGVAAQKITLDSPKSLTESTETWGIITAAVTPEDYDPANLEWKFEPSDEELGFEYAKVSDLQYNIRFKSYKENGNVKVTVTDLVGEMFAVREIAVEKKPTEGVVSLSLTPETVEIFIGSEPMNLNVICTPEKYDKSLLVWSSSDESVVKVDNGTITPVGEGEAAIKVKDSISGKTAESKVTVKKPVTDVVVKRIKLDQVDLELEVGGQDVQLKATCYDDKDNIVENYAGLSWKADTDINEAGIDVEVVKVSDQGVITPLAKGFTVVTVYVSSNSAVNATCDVSVKPKKIQVEEIIMPSSMIISPERSFSLNARVTPDEAEDKSLTYSSSDATVATVDGEGTVTGVALGEAVITATASNGVKAECKVVVAQQYIDLGFANTTMLIGNAIKLIPKLMPNGTTDVTVTWESSNPDVATIDETGNVKGLKEGSTVITATTADGISGTCTIIVEYDFQIRLSIDGEPATGNMDIHQFEELTINATYTNGYVPTQVEWTSSDPELATVTAYDGYAVVKVIYEGKIGKYDNKTVTITHRIGSKVSSKTFNVLPAEPKEIVVSNIPENNTLYLGDKLDLDVKILPEQALQDVTYWGPATGLFNGYNVAVRTGGPLELGITASDTYLSTTIYLTVIPRTVEGGSLTRENVAIEQGKSTLVKVDFVPADNENYDYTTEWVSADETIATVDGGRITGVGVGETTVTARIGNGDVLTCNVAVVDAVPSTVKVGDYYYADGRTSEYANVEGWAEMIGIVFSTVSPVDDGDDMLFEDCPDCTHGLVVALEEVEARVKWQSSSSDVHEWLAAKENYRNLTDTGHFYGYSNTKMLRLYNESNPDNKVLVVDQTPAVTLPEGTSGWYVPSYAELKMIKDNLAVLQAKGLVIDDAWKGTSIKDGYYWSSTSNDEVTNIQAYGMNMSPHSASNPYYVENILKSNELKVRHIFAF